MADQFKYTGLNRLIESLDATGVLSKDYAADVIGWALHACGEAHAAGVEVGRRRERSDRDRRSTGGVVKARNRC